MVTFSTILRSVQVQQDRPPEPFAWWVVPATVMALMGFGVVMVHSAAAIVPSEPGWTNWLETTAGKQSIFAVCAAVLMLVISRLDLVGFLSRGKGMLSGANVLLAVTVLLLVAVYIPAVGIETNGARRWIGVGSVLRFQPSELAKFSLVIYLAVWCTSRQEQMGSFWRGVLPTVGIIGLVVGLIVIEDFGTAVLLLVVAGCVIWAGGAKLWQLLLLAMPAAAGLTVLLIRTPYRLERLTAFLNPWEDPGGAGYHPIQSLVTICTGSWLGRGVGNGIQKYGYLPEDTTDFIFSVICEEAGIIGGLAVLALFAVFAVQCWRILMRCRSSQAGLVVLGFTLVIGVQAAMNIAVATVSVPTKGIALPFVSKGGTGLLIGAAAAGLIAGIGRRSGTAGSGRGVELSADHSPQPRAVPQDSKAVTPHARAAGDVPDADTVAGDDDDIHVFDNTHAAETV